MNGRVLAFSFVVALVVGIAFGRVPSSLVRRQSAVDALKSGSRGATVRRHRAGSSLVIAEVVDVAGDVKNNGLAREPMYEMYTPYAQRPWPAMQFALRAAGGDPLALVPSVRAAVLAEDRDLPITRVETMDTAFSDSVATERLLTGLLMAFAIVALVMAAAGLYGVISYTVAQRTQEIGVRVALGAEPRSVVRMVAVEGVRLTAIGMAIGTIAALLVSRAMRSVLFGVSAADPVTDAGVVLLFAATAWAALVVPAHRASTIDPIAALRQE